jgi:hypothetical protein
MGSLALTIQTFVLFPLGRPDFVLEGVGSVHQPGPAAVRVSLGAEQRF